MKGQQEIQSIIGEKRAKILTLQKSRMNVRSNWGAEKINGHKLMIDKKISSLNSEIKVLEESLEERK